MQLFTWNTASWCKTFFFFKVASIWCAPLRSDWRHQGQPRVLVGRLVSFCCSTDCKLHLFACSLTLTTGCMFRNRPGSSVRDIRRGKGYIWGSLSAEQQLCQLHVLTPSIIIYHVFFHRSHRQLTVLKLQLRNVDFNYTTGYRHMYSVVQLNHE